MVGDVVGRVVDDDIKEDFDVAGVRGRDKVQHLLFGAKVGVNALVIFGPVTMIRPANALHGGAIGLGGFVFKDGGQPEGGDTHVLQVVELALQPSQVAAVVEGFVGDKVARLGEGSAGEGTFVVAGVAIIEPVGHEEIENFALDGVGNDLGHEGVFDDDRVGEDGQTAAVAIQINVQHLVGCHRAEGDGGRVGATADRANLVVPAIIGYFGFGCACGGNGIGEEALVVAQTIQCGGDGTVVPTLPRPNGHKGRGKIIPHIDDIGGGHEWPTRIAAVIVGIKGEFDDLAGHAGYRPRIVAGGVVGCPVAGVNFELVTAGGDGHGDIQAKQPVATDKVAIEAIIVEREAVFAPAVKFASHAPCATACGAGGDGQTAAQPIPVKGHDGVAGGDGKGNGARIFVAAVGSNLIIPAACACHFGLIIAGGGKGIGEDLVALAQIGHGGGDGVVVPALPRADHGVAIIQGIIPPDIDNVGGGGVG